MPESASFGKEANSPSMRERATSLNCRDRTAFPPRVQIEAARTTYGGQLASFIYPQGYMPLSQISLKSTERGHSTHGTEKGTLPGVAGLCYERWVRWGTDHVILPLYATHDQNYLCARSAGSTADVHQRPPKLLLTFHLIVQNEDLVSMPLRLYLYSMPIGLIRPCSPPSPPQLIRQSQTSFKDPYLLNMR